MTLEEAEMDAEIDAEKALKKAKEEDRITVCTHFPIQNMRTLIVYLCHIIFAYSTVCTSYSYIHNTKYIIETSC